MLLIVIAECACELHNRGKRASHYGQQQVDKRQLLERIWHAAPSTSLKGARENIETELVQLFEEEPGIARE